MLQVVGRKGCRAARFIFVVLLFAIRTAFRLISVDMTLHGKIKAQPLSTRWLFYLVIVKADVLKAAIRVL